jgi:hypothetical protein
LQLELGVERLAGEVEYWQVPLPGVGFDRAEPQFAADALELLADVDGSDVEVDVGPAQTEDFAPAQPVQD